MAANLTVEELLDKYAGLSWAIARTMGKSYRLSRADQEDIFSAIKFRLVKHYGKINFSRPDFEGYVRSLLSNSARDELKKILRFSTPLVPMPEGGEDYLYPAPPQPDPVDSLARDRICEEALSSLSARHRKMVEMFMAGITTKEIAARVRHKNGKPYTAPTVASIISSFRRKAQSVVKAKHPPQASRIRARTHCSAPTDENKAA